MKPADEIEKLLPINLDDLTWWSVLNTIQKAGNQSTFFICRDLLNSDDKSKKILAALILSKLGSLNDDNSFNQKGPYKEESVELIETELYASTDDEVIDNCISSLGLLLCHTDNSKIARLSQFVSSKNSEIRKTLCHALSNKNTVSSINCLITLLSDSEEMIREWAAFYLGLSLSASEYPQEVYPAIISALLERLTDSDQYVRVESIRALSYKLKLELREAISQEIALGDPLDDLFEAIKNTQDTYYIKLLEKLEEEELEYCDDEADLETSDELWIEQFYETLTFLKKLKTKKEF